MLPQFMVGSSILKGTVASEGMMFIPSVMNISPLIQLLDGTDTACEASRLNTVIRKKQYNKNNNLNI